MFRPCPVYRSLWEGVMGLATFHPMLGALVAVLDAKSAAEGAAGAFILFLTGDDEDLGMISS